MKHFFTAVVIATFTSLPISLALGETVRQSLANSKKSLIAEGKDLEQWVREGVERRADLNICYFGYRTSVDGITILSLGREAAASGLEKHDVLYSVGGVILDKENFWTEININKYKKGDLVKIVSLREGKSVELEYPCPHSLDDLQKSFTRISKAMIKANYKQCRDLLTEHTGKFGRGLREWSIQNECYNYYLLREEPTHQLNYYHIFLVNEYKFKIDWRSYDLDALKDFESDLIGVQAYIGVGSAHSNSLQRYYDEALAKRMAVNERGVGPRSISPGREVMTAEGTCFFISPDGLAVTNNHVITGATGVNIIDADGESHLAELVTRDVANDLAVLKVETSSQPFLSIASFGSLSQGEEVFTLGFPG